MLMLTMRREDEGDKGFKLNGVNMSLRDIAMNVVLNYAQNHSSMSAKQIRDFFVNLCMGAGVSHVVETEQEYHMRDGQQSQKRTSSEISIPSGEKLYVSTQLRAKKESDNFIKFMKIINDNGLGTISR